MSALTTPSPLAGVPTLLEQLFAAQEKRLTTPTSECVGLVLGPVTMTDAEFDALHGGRELLPIEQAAYEAEGAERFAKFHGHGRTFPKNAEFPDAPVLATEADCEEADMCIHRWKVGGGPVREHDARAVAIELGSRRFS